jgi:DNA-binding XRE family transcriptional regulator
MTKKKTLRKRKPKIKGTLSAEALEVLALPSNTLAAPSKTSEMLERTWSGQDIREVLLESLVTETLGDMLQQARQERNITGETLGKRMGVSKSRIAQLEALKSDKVELQTLTQYARALGYQVNISFIPEESKGKVLSASL